METLIVYKSESSLSMLPQHEKILKYIIWQYTPTILSKLLYVDLWRSGIWLNLSRPLPDNVRPDPINLANNILQWDTEFNWRSDNMKIEYKLNSYAPANVPTHFICILRRSY